MRDATLRHAFSYAVFSSTARAAGRHAQALKAMAKARLLGGGAVKDELGAEIAIRSAYSKLTLARASDGSLDWAGLLLALSEAEAVLDVELPAYYTARVKNCVGTIAFFAGRRDYAFEQATSAATLLQAPQYNLDLVASLSIMASCKASGSGEEKLIATRLLNEMRASLPQRAPIVRAHLFWCEALIHADSPRRRAKAIRLFFLARRRFIQRKLWREAVAVTLEIIKLQPFSDASSLLEELRPAASIVEISSLLDRLNAVSPSEKRATAKSLLAELPNRIRLTA